MSSMDFHHRLITESKHEEKPTESFLVSEF
jgi:hypothetical protein